MKEGDTESRLCFACRDYMNHVVKGIHGRELDPYDSFHEHFLVFQCNGCGAFSACRRVTDTQDMYDGPDEWECRYSEESWPQVIPNHRPIEIRPLPEPIDEVYLQVLEALAQKMWYLAAAGLRMLVEGICKEKGINERDLYKNIEKLKANGHITNQKYELLHATRLVGNDAAHIDPAFSPEACLEALPVVESVLYELYVLPKGKPKLDKKVEEERIRKLGLRERDEN